MMSKPAGILLGLAIRILARYYRPNAGPRKVHFTNQPRMSAIPPMV
jgi:hypothetical protein